MIRGGKFWLVGGCLAAAACAQTQSVKVRAIADPAAKVRFGGGLLAEARGQLALGDVGIALETFRTLSREQPENADAYSGIAACYAAMGRYDIARQNYEFALAYAPNDPALLTALASSLDRLGEADRAAQIRLEASRLRAAPAAPVSLAQTVVTPLAVPRLSSVTVRLPELSPVAAAPTRSMRVADAEQKSAPAIGAAQLTPTAVRLSSAPVAPTKTELAARVEISIPAQTEALQAVETAIAAPQLTPTAVKLSSVPLAPNGAELSSNVDVLIPVPPEALLAPEPLIAPPRLTPVPVKLGSVRFAPGDAQLASNVEIAIPATRKISEDSTPLAEKRQPAIAADRAREAVAAQVEPQANSGPYLQRLSSGEVSLVTNRAPVRVAHSTPRLPEAPLTGRTDVVTNSPLRSQPRLASAAAVRWVPLKYAPAWGTIQLLNAARTDSLAARMRVALLDRGWRKIRIGNARKARQHSLVLYASARSAVARRLAAHFGCKAVRTDRVQNVVVLLGRDVALSRRGSQRA
jgi:tetratricopeptide (TPR) repeat protein